MINTGPIDAVAANSPNAYWEVGGRSISKMDTLYLATITRSTGLLIGAAFAMLWRPVAVMRGPLRDKGRQLDLLALAGLTALGALAYYLHVVIHNDVDATVKADPWLFRGGFLAVALATVLVMAAVTHRGAMAGRLLGNPALNWVGTRSYGLYLYHWPIYQIIREQAGERLTFSEFALAMLLTAVITEFSYRFIEMPIRKQQLGRWWERVQETSDPKPKQLIVGGAVAIGSIFGFAAVSMATAPLQQNDVQERIDEEAGNNVDIAAQLGTSTTAAPVLAPMTSVVAVTSPSATAAQPTAAPSTSVAPTTASVVTPYVAIGDSVMAGAITSLQAEGFTVDAQESRQFDAAIPIAQALVQSGNAPEVVVVHLGTNGDIDEDDARAFFTMLKDVPRVIVLTVNVNKPWRDSNNEMIVAFQTEFPNVSAAYWAEQADGCATWAEGQGRANPNCYASDGLHLSEDGADYYAAMIAGWAGI